jgi:ribonuclease P/MRP protein subunit RPP1
LWSIGYIDLKPLPRVVGYTVIAFNQIVQKKIDLKTHVNELDPLLGLLRKRTGIIFLKRLTIVLDEDSEKGFGLVSLFSVMCRWKSLNPSQTNGNISLVQPYDIIALTPTTSATFSHACLMHSLPSPLTAHIISLPLTLPRLPFHLKHTLVRTAIKNGAVFEIAYAGALGGDGDISIGGGESGAGAKRNWWAAARELARVTKGKGLIVSGGVGAEADLRAPRDISNLLFVSLFNVSFITNRLLMSHFRIMLLGLATNLAHDTSTTTPKSLVLRARMFNCRILSFALLTPIRPRNTQNVSSSSLGTEINNTIDRLDTNFGSRSRSCLS